MTHKSYMEPEFADMNGFSSFFCIKNMSVGTKTMTLAGIETKILKNTIFLAAILDFAIYERTVRDRAGCPLDLDSAYPKTYNMSFSCLYPKVHAHFTSSAHYQHD